MKEKGAASCRPLASIQPPLARSSETQLTWILTAFGLAISFFGIVIVNVPFL